MMVPSDPEPAGDLRRAICLCLLGIFLFQVLNLLGKHLTDTYPIPVLVFFRSFFALLACALLVARTGGRAFPKARRPEALMLRALVWLAMLYCSFAAYHLLPVPDAATIGFSAPIFVAALAAGALGERMSLGCWMAVAVGFLGVVVTLRPGGDLLHLGSLAALGNAVLYALGAVMVRALSRSESSATIVLYCCLVTTAVSALLLPAFWKAPTLSDLALLCLLGMLGAAAQYLATEAFRHAPASLVAPFTYSGLIWALLLGYLIWGERPDGLGMLGAGLIVAAGLYLLSAGGAARVARAAPPTLQPVGAAAKAAVGLNRCSRPARRRVPTPGPRC